jgi:hypothetical protein
MLQRTAKSCGPDAPTLASSSRSCVGPTGLRQDISADDGGKRARSPGRARRKPLKPLRAGTSGDSGVLVYSCAFLPMQSAHEAAGATGTRRSPRPLWAEELNNASGASRREGVNARLKSGIFVGWAKPPGPANARPMTGSACPPFKNDDVDGGHGASAPLPTLRNLIEYERVRHAQPSSPAKRAIQYSEVLAMESKSCDVLDTPLEPVMGSPQARPGGGV